MSDLTDRDDDISDENEADEGIIELTSIVEDDLENEVDDETIIELTDIVQEDAPEFNLDITTEDDSETEEPVETEEQIEIEEPVEEAFNGLELDIESQHSGEPVPGENEGAAIQELSVTQEQIEAALERVIEKKFADKIETILFEKMVIVVEREIADIKERLQRDLDQIGNT